jgi:hypothetical protein
VNTTRIGTGAAAALPPAMPALLVLLVLSAGAGCGGDAHDRPARPRGPAVWVAPSAATLSGEGARLLAAAGAEEVFLAAAEVEPAAGGLALRPVPEAFRGAVPRGTPVTLVARGPFGGTVPVGDPKAAGAALAEALRSLALDAEEAGLLPLGVHLEAEDDPGGGPAPADLVRAVRTGLGAELLLSISLPRRVLDPAATPEDAFEAAAESARAADFVVVDLYGHPADAEDDPAAWDPERVQADLVKLGELGVDFVAGLHVVGTAWHLDSSGARVEGQGSTRADLKALALDPGLRLEIDPFASNGRLLYAFQAQAPARVAVAGSTWRLAPGESIRVSRSAPPVARWILDVLEQSGLDGYTGPLFRRIGAADERLAFQPADVAAALRAESGGPELGWRIVVESRFSDSVVLGIELENRGTQSTDLVTTEGNYLEVKAQNGHFTAVEPGDFTRYTLWRGDQEARPGIGWREPDGVRLSTPMIDGGERVGGARLTLRTTGGAPRISVAGRFVSTGGEVLELPVTEGVVETSLSGPSTEEAAVEGE